MDSAFRNSFNSKQMHLFPQIIKIQFLRTYQGRDCVIPRSCLFCLSCVVRIHGTESNVRQLEQVPVPVYHPTPSQTRLATQLTEEEQIRIAQRIGLIQHLPKGVYDPGRDGSEKKIRECVICMMDFVYGDPIRFLPCMHIYHLDCIDDWLMRSFTCPSCMEPVDAALLSSYETN
ncbi:PREDICTED: RING finger protein 11 [Gavialis gangeticus]|uniref:RING finger protein 11 n=1 Tax=Gavialis gangeticus TaxID=94835 RepID=UPI00092F092E|nr:PREDICTED: RING finger protein 11 [Gavialis gangeticus]